MIAGSFRLIWVVLWDILTLPTPKKKNDIDYRCRSRCCIVGGSVSVGVDFEVSKVHAQLIFSLLAVFSCCSSTLNAAILLPFPAVMIKDSASETVSKPPVKYFPFIRINFVMVSPHSSRTVTKTMKWNGCMIGWFWILVEPRVSSIPGKCLISKLKPSKGLWVQKPVALAVVSV